MARAGYCTSCGTNAWLKDDGACAMGHPASCVSGVYEAGQPQPVPVAPKKDRTALVVVIAVAVLAALFACGVLVAIAVPVFMNASGDAAMKSCFANERTVEGAAQTYLAINEGATLPSDWDGLMSVLVGPVIKGEPACPSGGAYSITSSDGSLKVDCSVHGTYGGPAAP